MSNAASTQMLHEVTTCQGTKLRVDAEAGVIRGVKILGTQSRNGRTYPATTLLKARELYEDVRVNVNHPVGIPTQVRDYRDRIGVIRSVVVCEDGLYADLHYNPKHALASQLVWDAEKAPRNVGFSHVVQAKTKRQRDGQMIVEAIEAVKSVDLVSDPATTSGLFESDTETEMELDGANERKVSTMTLAEFRAEHPEMVQSILQEHRNSEEETARRKAETDRRDAETAKATTLTEELTATVATLTEENAALKAEKLRREKDAAIEQLLSEAKLPEQLVTTEWRESLMAMELDPAKAVIEAASAAYQLKAGKPKSQEQVVLEEGEGKPKPSVKEFTEMVT